MDINQYAATQAKLIKPMQTKTLSAVHMALGIGGEAGEVIDLIKKPFAYEREFDRIKITEEIGDLMFYISGLLGALDISWDEVLEGNVAKLATRYKTGSFSNEQALNRDTAAEHDALSLVVKG